MLRLAGVDVASDLADQLAADAVADTTAGEVRWNPDACPLGTHLCGVIRARTRHRLVHEGAFPHGSLDRDDASGATRHALPAPANLERDLGRRAVRDRIVRALYEAAERAKDDLAALLLAAYEDGVSGRAEVIDHLGIAPAEYDNARKRLARLVASLPEGLRDDAIEAMRERP